MADEDVTIFITCMLATIPISRLLSLGSDEIAKRVGFVNFTPFTIPYSNHLTFHNFLSSQ
jgi:hypothetical protein